MRQTAAALNRAWLTVIGVLLLLAGLATVIIGTGHLAPIATAIGVTVDRPKPADHILDARSVTSALSQTWLILVVGAIGVVVALLALGWITAQIPRSNQARPFRLHDDAEDGLTRCDPRVLTDAVTTQIRALPGVHDASAVLRGTSTEPDLTLRVTTDHHTSIPGLLHTLQSTIAHDLGTALDTTVRKLCVQIEIGSTTSHTDHITL